MYTCIEKKERKQERERENKNCLISTYAYINRAYNELNMHINFGFLVKKKNFVFSFICTYVLFFYFYKPTFSL